jgi:non-specific protein-tyrosine kinase
MELKWYFSVVRKWWWLLVASVLVATVSSYIAVSKAPRIYEATTTIRVGQAIEKANPTYQDFSISQQLAQTYMDMVSRLPVLEGAADALGLAYLPDTKDISARLVPGTQFLEISVRDTNPERARALADSIAQQLILQTPNEIAKDQARQDFVQEQLERLEESIQATVEELRTEQEKLAAATSARAIEQYQNNVDALEGKLADDQSTYASLLQTVEGRTNYISVFEKATTPTSPISPREVEALLLAGAIGLLLALGGAFLIEFTDNTVKTAEDLRESAGRPVLGTIARMRGSNPESKLIAHEQPRSPIAEAYRGLRTNILLSSGDHPIRTLLVTSPSQFEGKTTTVTNLGVVVAQSGQKVLLVDADLRRATLHKVLQVPNEKGVTTAFTQDESLLNGCLQQTEIENLRAWTSGPLPPNPSELLGSQKMKRFIEQLKDQVDLIVFDTPPALQVTDAVVLAKQVDGVLIVTESGRTQRPVVQRTVETLQQVGANVVGTVLNCASRGHLGAYGHYYASDITYGQKPEKTRWFKKVPLLRRLFPR